jgi:nucleotide-binding universal stress UspA family protein
MIRKILIAVDDSTSAEKVAREGFRLAKQSKAEVALISVADTVLLPIDSGITRQEMVQMLKDSFKKSQQLLMDKVFKSLKVKSFIEEGDPYKLILKIATEWNANLIVMGTHGHTGIPHLLMGSVAEKIVRHSTKPIVIIPTRKEG